MKRFLALALALAIVFLGVPGVSSAAGRQASSSSQVAGTATSQAGTPMANTTVRLRNMATGEVAATSRTSASGAYTFAKVPAGNYVVELVDNNGAVIATSAPVALATGSMSIQGVALTPAAGKAGVGAVAGTSTGHFFTSTAGIVLLVGAGAGAVAGVVVATRTTSPSR